MKSLILFIVFFVLAKNNLSSAQEIDLDNLKIDSSKLTLYVSIMKGCVISPLNYMEFKFYTDSTIVKFCPSLENSMIGGVDEVKQIVVPINLRNRIEKYQETLEEEGRRIDITQNPQYRLEFDRFVGYAEYRLSPEEHMVLSDWFDEFNTK